MNIRKDGGSKTEYQIKDFHLLIENASDIITLLDDQGVIRFMSPSTKRVLDYQPEDMVGLKYAAFLHPEDVREVAEAIRAAIYNPDRSVSVEFRIRDREGSWHTFESIGRAVPGEGGKTFGIINSRDITERKKAESETQRRLDEVSLLSRIITLTASAKNINAALEEVCSELAQFFEAPRAGVTLLSPDRTTAEVVAEFRREEQPSGVGMIFPLDDYPSMLFLLENRTPYGIMDTRHDERVSSISEILHQFGVVSMLLIPIQIGDEITGTLGLNFNEPREFEEDELKLAQHVAHQLGQTLDRLRLFTTSLEYNKQMDQLAKLSETLNHPLGVAEVQAKIGRGAMELSGSDRGALYMRSETDSAICVWSQGLSQNYLEEVIAQIKDVPGGNLLKGTEPILISDIQRLPQEALIRQLSEREGHQAIGLWPLIYEGKVIAAIGSYYKESHVWTEGEQAVMNTFARQAAVALESARLFKAERAAREEIQKRAAELEALAAVSSALRTAPTHKELIPIIVERVGKVMKTEHAGLSLRDPKTGETILATGRGVWKDQTGSRLPPNTGIHGHVIATRQAYVSEDVRGDPKLARPEIGKQIKAVACLPLNVQHQCLGALWIGRQTAIAEQEVHLLTAIADMAANAIHRASLHEETQRQVNQLQAMRAIDIAISASMDLQVTLNILLDHVTSQLKVDAASVLLLNTNTQSLEFASGRGFHSKAIEQMDLRLGEGLAGRAALERTIIQVQDLRQTKEELAREALLLKENFISYYGAPLLAKGRVLGVLDIFHRSQLEADPDWVDFLETLSSQAAIAIENTRLFNELQKANTELSLAYDTTLEGWSRALELRDSEPEGHTQRVTETSLHLARAMGVNDEQLVHVRRGALLHDIGKMAIPDSILQNPGPLNEGEWEIMRQHPLYAHQLLSPISFLRPALEIPYFHHEKWDGSGYPHGLEREQIPLPARIFAVVDVRDSMTCDRPYRRAKSREEALEYIRQQAGKHFDPQVVAKFLDIIQAR